MTISGLLKLIYRSALRNGPAAWRAALQVARELGVDAVEFRRIAVVRAHSWPASKA